MASYAATATAATDDNCFSTYPTSDPAPGDEWAREEDFFDDAWLLDDIPMEPSNPAPFPLYRPRWAPRPSTTTNTTSNREQGDHATEEACTNCGTGVHPIPPRFFCPHNHQEVWICPLCIATALPLVRFPACPHGLCITCVEEMPPANDSPLAAMDRFMCGPCWEGSGTTYSACPSCQIAYDAEGSTPDTHTCDSFLDQAHNLWLEEVTHVQDEGVDSTFDVENPNPRPHQIYSSVGVVECHHDDI